MRINNFIKYKNNISATTWVNRGLKLIQRNKTISRAFNNSILKLYITYKRQNILILLLHDMQRNIIGENKMLITKFANDEQFTMAGNS